MSLFVAIPELSYSTVEQVEESFCAKNPLDPFNHFVRTPTCDRQTGTAPYIASTALAQRGAGKNVICNTRSCVIDFVAR